MSEDQQGLIWMASNRGVLRYDGFQCINISKYLKEKFPDKVKSNQENTVFADSLGQVWMGGNKGVSIYNLHTNEYENIYLDAPLYPENYRNQIKRFVVFNGEMYVCTNNGLYILNMSTLEVNRSYLTSGKIQEDRHNTFHAVQGVYPNLKDSLIYIQANDGMHILNKYTDEERIVITDKLAKSEYWGDNKHWFYQGTVVDDVIVTSTYNTGIVHFDINKEAYDVFLPDPTRKIKPNRNIFKSLTAFNDSISILTGASNGLFIYEYPEKNLTKIIGAPHFGNWGLIDSHGHYWAGKWGEVFRSIRVLGTIGHKYQSLQLGEAFSKGISLGYPTFENMNRIDFEESQNNLKMFLSLTHAYDYDSMVYEYRLCSNEWTLIEENILNIESIKGGLHKLELRARSDETIIDSCSIDLFRHVSWYKKWYYLLTLFFTLGFISYLISNRRVKLALEKEKIKSDYELKIAKLNTAALRSRMNPHFLFNTLNSIKHHAIFKAKEETGEYITEFSQLIRGILEYSELDFLSLDEDIEWIRNYINIEKKRFKSPFLSSIEVDPALDLEQEKIPPLIIQPFIENCIWHGLFHKSQGHRKITLQYAKLDNGYQVVILDNGVGREKSKKLNNKGTSKKMSLGMKITQDRFDQINSTSAMKVFNRIYDLYDDNGNANGTKVILQFIKSE